MSKLKAVAFIAVIASGTFFANPTWGAEGLPRDAAGNVIINRWIQAGESFWINPAAWVHTYQHYCNQIPQGPGIEVQLPDDSPAPEAQPEDSATNSVAQPEADQAAPAPDQADQAAPKPAPKKKKAAAPKAAAAPAPEADQAAPAPDQADQADPQE